MAIIHRGRLVVQAPTRELIGPVDRQLIRFATSADADRAADVLGTAGFPIADRAVNEALELVVSTDDPRAVLRSLSDAGLFPLEVRPQVRTLESVFLALTGERAAEEHAASSAKSRPGSEVQA